MKRIDLTEPEIAKLVTAFYRHIRQHPDLGPFFAKRITPEDWPAHEAKIASFWANAILRQRGYSGNPMAIHSGMPDLEAHHFGQWLALFDETAKAELNPKEAQALSDLADRIGRSLAMGVAQRRALAATPDLRG